MAKSNDQLIFNFQQQTNETPCTDHTVAYDLGPQFNRMSNVAIYCLEHRRAAKMKREAAVHFSAILNLVAHIK